MSFTTGKRYRVSLYGLIGDTSLIEGELASTTLGSYVSPESNAAVNHANIYPTIPEEVRKSYKDDYTSYSYLHLVTDAGTHYYVGMPWINASMTVELSNTLKVVEISDPLGRDDSELISLLESRDYNVSSITEKNVV